MAGYFKHGSTWSEIKQVFVKQGGAWVEGKEGYVKDGATWKKVWPASSPPPFTGTPTRFDTIFRVLPGWPHTGGVGPGVGFSHGAADGDPDVHTLWDMDNYSVFIDPGSMDPTYLCFLGIASQSWETNTGGFWDHFVGVAIYKTDGTLWFKAAKSEFSPSSMGGGQCMLMKSPINWMGAAHKGYTLIYLN